MKLGSAVVIVVALGAPGASGLNLGCSHEARPVVQPDEHPPLPPAAGTPIGHLVDSAGELKLSSDQVTRLQTINDELAGQLTADDTEMRPDPVAPAPREDKPRGLGFRAGTSTADGMGTGASGFPGIAGGGGNPGDGASSGQVVIPASTVTHVYRQRARHVHDAIGRALGLLDAVQQIMAKRVLTDHGVNLDTGEVASGDPGAAKLEEPKQGQPLPREP